MVIIEYQRFVLEPETLEIVGSKNKPFEKVRYHKEFDHSDKLNDNDFNLLRIKQVIKRWEKDHYGLVTIFIMGIDEYTRPHKIKIHNRRKFWRDMIERGVIIEEDK